MISTWKVAAIAAALALTSAPASALTLPLIGDVEHPDFDPFHVMTPPPPEAPPAAAPAAAPMKHHHKKMMKHKMKKKKM